MRKAYVIGVLFVTMLLILGACAPAEVEEEEEVVTTEEVVTEQEGAATPEEDEEVAPAKFEVISLSIKPLEAIAGEAVVITAVVENIGGSEGTYAVILTVDGVTVEVKEAAITAGSSEVVTFSLVKDTPGTYEISIGGLTSALIVKEEPIPVVEQVELKYDDGTPDGAGSVGGYGFLVCFTPPVTPFQINSVKIFTVLRGSDYENQKARFEIWDKNFEVLHYWEKPATTFSHEPNWETFEIQGVSVDDDFYVVFYPCSTREGGVYLHYDSSQINNGSEYAGPSGGITDWISTLPKEKTNWMIRVVGTPGEEGAPVTSSPSKIIEGSAEFQETVSSLDSPLKLSRWILDNIQYESRYEVWKETGVNYRAPPEEIFETKVGCCAEYAIFACYVLEYHRYEAEIQGIAVESDPSKGHAVCVYQSSGSLYTINIGRIEGPYQTYEDIALNHDKDWSSYMLYDSWDKYQKLGSADKVVYYTGSAEFKKAVSLLDTPEKVSEWVAQNIEYKSEDVNEYAPAWVIFERGYDDCDGFATIQAYFLKANGYDAWNIGIAIETSYGHNVCGYKDNDRWYVLDVNGIMRGPFESLEQLADEVGDLYKIPRGSSIYLIDPFDVVSTTSFPKYEVYRQ